MNPAIVAPLILSALQALESDGIITIGGWAASDVTAVITALSTVLTAVLSGTGDIVSLVEGALTNLETQGVIKIGGWDPAAVNKVIALAASFLKGVMRPDDGSPDNPGLGSLSNPAGTTGSEPAPSAPTVVSATTGI